MAITGTGRGRWTLPPNSIDNYWRYGSLGLNAATTNSQTWGTNNLIVYVPIPVSQRVNVVKLWAGVGSVATGNIDMGIYDRAGNLIISNGLVAKVAGPDEQVFNITDTLIGPDLYYLAVLDSVSSDTFVVAPASAPIAASAGLRVQTNASLPSTATWTISQTLGFVPLVGMFLEGTPA